MDDPLIVIKKEIIVGIWTHTNNVVKVDCKNKIDDFSEYFGKEIVYMVHSENYRNKKHGKLIGIDMISLRKKNLKFIKNYGMNMTCIPNCFCLWAVKGVCI